MRIGRPVRTNNPDGSSVVAAEVDGELIWFSSKDVPLSATPEAFTSAMLVAAASMGSDLQVDVPLDSVWLKNSSAIQRQVNDWWGLPGSKIIADTAPSSTTCEKPKCSAQCFTGGIDSYYELYTASPFPKMLVFVHGYDIRLHDVDRLNAFLVGFRETAAAFDAQAVLITTNLREHPIIRKSSWGRIHGGALAAVGHLLSETISDLTIPSSYPYHDPKPWGSHWDLDPFWSTSLVSFRHGDATLRRNGKVKAIGANDLVRRNIRVCHENKAKTGNCSRCEKCVRTMIAFSSAGLLNRCQAFDQQVPLARRVERLARVGEHLISVFEELRGDITDPALAFAVDALISRSRLQPPRYRKKLENWRERLLVGLEG
jgi:hypothetical protein